jgi:hypothetical protein
MPFDNLNELIRPFQAAVVARTVQLHLACPGRDGLDRCYVATMRLWLTSGRERKLVSAGSDGFLSVTALDDGETASNHGSPESSWKVTSENDSPCHTVAVYQKASVAFTGSECEATGCFWDLRSRKRLCKVHDLKFKDSSVIISTSFCASGTLAYINSNNADDDVLKLLSPQMPHK